MGAINLVGRLPPLPLPEYDQENLSDIEVEEPPLPPGTGSTPLEPTAEKGEGAKTERGQQPPPPKHRKPNPQSPAASTTTLGSLPDLTDGFHTTSRGPGSGSPLPSGLHNIIHRMLYADKTSALNLLQQMGPALGDSIPYQLPFCSPSEAATLTAHIPINVIVAATTATAVRNQRVADFTTAAGSAAHAAAITSCATEEKAAQAAQTAAGASLTTAQAAIAEADATNSTA